MKRVLLIVAAVMVMVSSSAFAAGSSESGIYCAPKFTLSVLHTRGTLDLAASTWGPRRVFGARAGGALALGYDFRKIFQVPLRVELEYGASDHVSKSASIKVFRKRFPFRAKIGVQTMLFNSYVDMHNSTGFTPYVGAGAGVAFISAEVKGMGLSSSGSYTVPAGQVGLGCSYSFNENIALDVGYRFVLMGNVETLCDSIQLNLRRNYMHQVMLGLRITF